MDRQIAITCQKRGPDDLGLDNQADAQKKRRLDNDTARKTALAELRARREAKAKGVAVPINTDKESDNHNAPAPKDRPIAKATGARKPLQSKTPNPKTDHEVRPVVVKDIAVSTTTTTNGKSTVPGKIYQGPEISARRHRIVTKFAELEAKAQDQKVGKVNKPKVHQLTVQQETTSDTEDDPVVSIEDYFPNARRTAKSIRDRRRFAYHATIDLNSIRYQPEKPKPRCNDLELLSEDVRKAVMEVRAKHNRDQPSPPPRPDNVLELRRQRRIAAKEAEEARKKEERRLKAKQKREKKKKEKAGLKSGQAQEKGKATKASTTETPQNAKEAKGDGQAQPKADLETQPKVDKKIDVPKPSETRKMKGKVAAAAAPTGISKKAPSPKKKTT
jgi:hypothetical protein